MGASSTGAEERVGVVHGDGLALGVTSRSCRAPLATTGKVGAWESGKKTAGWRMGTLVTAPKQRIWRSLIQEEMPRSAATGAADTEVHRSKGEGMTRVILMSGWKGVVILRARACRMAT